MLGAMFRNREQEPLSSAILGVYHVREPVGRV